MREPLSYSASPRSVREHFFIQDPENDMTILNLRSIFNFTWTLCSYYYSLTTKRVVNGMISPRVTSHTLDVKWTTSWVRRQTATSQRRWSHGRVNGRKRPKWHQTTILCK